MADCLVLQERPEIFNAGHNIFVQLSGPEPESRFQFSSQPPSKRRDFGAAGHSAPLWRGCLPERQESTEEGAAMCLVFSDFSEVVRTLMIFGVSDMAISAVLSSE